MNHLSKTMRIDIPPDLKEELRRHDRKYGRLSISSPSPDLTDTSSSIGQSSSDFQALFQSVYDGALIADLNGQIIDVNDRVTHFLLCPREKLIAMNLMQIISGATEETLHTLQTGIEKDRFILIQAYCIRNDNTLFPAEIAVNRLRIKGKECLCCFIRDTTWRRQAEEMLRTVHTAIQNAATGIAVADLNGEVDYINQTGARIWGHDSIQAVRGKNLRELIPDPELSAAMIEAVKQGQPWNGEIVIPGKDGNSVQVRLAVAPNRDVDEQLIGMVVSLLDISDRIRAREAEQQADRQRVMVESLGAACHHLGQPATVLLSSIELLNRVWTTDKAMAEELIASSIVAAESLRKMLHNLNDITEYRTTTYIDSRTGSGHSETRILDVGTLE